MSYNYNCHHLIVVIIICIVVVIIIVVIYVVGYIDHGIHNGQRKRHESPGRQLNSKRYICKEMYVIMPCYTYINDRL